MDKATKRRMQRIAEGKTVFYLGQRFKSLRGLHELGYVRLRQDRDFNWVAKLTREGAEYMFNEKQKGDW